MSEIRYRYDESTNTKIPYNHTELPTAEEYVKVAPNCYHHWYDRWSEPKYQCPKCGGGMCKNLEVVLTTYPVKYMYRCDSCGYVENQYI